MERGESEETRPAMEGSCCVTIGIYAMNRPCLEGNVAGTYLTDM